MPAVGTTAAFVVGEYGDESESSATPSAAANAAGWYPCCNCCACCSQCKADTPCRFRCTINGQQHVLVRQGRIDGFPTLDSFGTCAWAVGFDPQTVGSCTIDNAILRLKSPRDGYGVYRWELKAYEGITEKLEWVHGEGSDDPPDCTVGKSLGYTSGATCGGSYPAIALPERIHDCLRCCAACSNLDTPEKWTLVFAASADEFVLAPAGGTPTTCTWEKTFAPRSFPPGPNPGGCATIDKITLEIFAGSRIEVRLSSEADGPVAIFLVSSTDCSIQHTLTIDGPHSLSCGLTSLTATPSRLIECGGSSATALCDVCPEQPAAQMRIDISGVGATTGACVASHPCCETDDECAEWNASFLLEASAIDCQWYLRVDDLCPQFVGDGQHGTWADFTLNILDDRITLTITSMTSGFSFQFQANRVPSDPCTFSAAVLTKLAGPFTSTPGTLYTACDWIAAVVTLTAIT